MKKIKKILLSLTTLAVVSTPVAFAISCGNTDKLPQNYIKPADRVAVINSSASFNADVAKKHPDVKIAMITDAGHVTDKSFNQSSWEAINEIYDQSGKKVQITDIEPQAANGTDFKNAYTGALQQGYNVWVLSGFTQEDALSNFLKDQNNVNALVKNNVKIICVDFALSEAENPHSYSNLYSLLFDVQDGAYIGGEAIADFLSQTYKGADNQSKRTVGTFGGLNIPPVTNYIMALLKGVYAFNQTTDGKTNPTQVNPNQTTVDLNSGFVISSKMDASINNLLTKSNPSVIFPVAGPATDETLSILDKDSAKYGNTTIIGVDVDQAIGKQDENKFDFSVTKNIGQAVYDVILATTYNIDPKNLLQGRDTSKSLTLIKGIEDGWVGVSKSHLSDSKQKELMNNLLTKYTEAFKQLTPSEISLIRSYKLTENDEDQSNKVSDFLTKLLGLINNKQN